MISKIVKVVGGIFLAVSVLYSASDFISHVVVGVRSSIAEGQQPVLRDDSVTIPEQVKVVEEFWRLASEGKMDAARELRTSRFLNFSIEVKNDPSPWEKTIFDAELTYVRTMEVRHKSSRECEIVSRVRTKDLRERLYFHTVVRNDDGPWRIFSITL